MCKRSVSLCCAAVHRETTITQFVVHTKFGPSLDGFIRRPFFGANEAQKTSNKGANHRLSPQLWPESFFSLGLRSFLTASWPASSKLVWTDKQSCGIFILCVYVQLLLLQDKQARTCECAHTHAHTYIRSCYFCWFCVAHKQTRAGGGAGDFCWQWCANVYVCICV